MNGERAEVDGKTTEMVKTVGPSIVEWLVCLHNLSMNMCNVQLAWSSAIIFSLKCNCDKKEYKKNSGTSLLNTTGICTEE
jgi:hypothetical protein